MEERTSPITVILFTNEITTELTVAKLLKYLKDFVNRQNKIFRKVSHISSTILKVLKYENLQGKSNESHNLSLAVPRLLVQW
jgi:hypothetical protein